MWNQMSMAFTRGMRAAGKLAQMSLVVCCRAANNNNNNNNTKKRGRIAPSGGINYDKSKRQAGSRQHLQQLHICENDAGLHTPTENSREKNSRKLTLWEMSVAYMLVSNEKASLSFMLPLLLQPLQLPLFLIRCQVSHQPQRERGNTWVSTSNMWQKKKQRCEIWYLRARWGSQIKSERIPVLGPKV